MCYKCSKTKAFEILLVSNGPMMCCWELVSLEGAKGHHGHRGDLLQGLISAFAVLVQTRCDEQRLTDWEAANTGEHRLGEPPS